MNKPIGDPLPVQLLGPWIEDNEKFQHSLNQRSARLADLSHLRNRLAIRIAQPAERCLLGAVDASQLQIEFGDQLSILVQGARIRDDGTGEFGKPWRITGINGHAFALAAMPMRIAEECRLLASSKEPTIADMSYWSALMDVNQSIARADHTQTEAIKAALTVLLDDRMFISVIENPYVIPMTKLSESDTLFRGVSDRQVLTMILHSGEYLAPRSLTNATGTSFKVERRGFTAGEQQLLQDYYDRRLGVVFYKPHDWSRAYRIEAHLDRLNDDAWLMPLLAAIKQHTIDRTIQEPWPQFMADFTVRRVAGVGRLYGQDNWHRHPEANYVQSRTQISGRKWK
jgi:hypothetical protein